MGWCRSAVAPTGEIVAHLGGGRYGASGGWRTGWAMKWRVMVEVTGEDGAVTRHVISEGHCNGN